MSIRIVGALAVLVGIASGYALRDYIDGTAEAHTAYVLHCVGSCSAADAPASVVVYGGADGESHCTEDARYWNDVFKSPVGWHGDDGQFRASCVSVWARVR